VTTWFANGVRGSVAGMRVAGNAKAPGTQGQRHRADGGGRAVDGGGGFGRSDDGNTLLLGLGQPRVGTAPGGWPREKKY